MINDSVLVLNQEEATAAKEWCTDRAAFYAALAEVYSHPLSEKWLRWFTSADFPVYLKSFICSQDSDTSLLDQGLDELQQSTEGKSLEQLVRELQAEHSFLLIRGACQTVHPYASVYLSEWKRVMGDAWEKARIFINESGFSLPEEGENKYMEDHLSVECEFMQLLCRAAAKATRRKKHDQLLASLKLQETFLREHMLTWVSKYCADVVRVSNHGFYRGMAKITEAFLVLDAASLKQFCEE
ncbi:MAG: molecular chaperone TorD family protein [Clostridium sp.]|nr:molecular chaperone TorD family protein [Clostridium sp.]